MNTPQRLRLLCFLAFSVISSYAESDNYIPSRLELNEKVDTQDKKLELIDGVYMKIPRENNTARLFSLEVNTNRSLDEGRGKKQKMLQRILPMFLLPFIIQSTIIPLVLGLLKFMLMKAMLIGKLGLTLIIINAFRNSNTYKGRDSEVASTHYGYHGNGMEEYASYLNH